MDGAVFDSSLTQPVFVVCARFVAVGCGRLRLNLDKESARFQRLAG